MWKEALMSDEEANQPFPTGFHQDNPGFAHVEGAVTALEEVEEAEKEAVEEATEAEEAAIGDSEEAAIGDSEEAAEEEVEPEESEDE
jgi:hypothetical protein